MKIPVRIGADTDWISIEAGGTHSLALKANGTLWAWGQNAFGQLGDNTLVDKSTPVQIDAAVDWVSVAAGGSHTLALKEDGTLWAWGKNSPSGQLGDNSFIDKKIPVQIGADTDWLSIAAGGNHSLALKSDWSLWAWGRNDEGELGNGTFTGITSPDQMQDASRDITPDTFSFTPQTDVALNADITSNTIFVAGINDSAPVSITGGYYSINGGIFTSASGAVNNGDSLRVLLSSSANYSTTTVAVLSINGISDTFRVTTLTATVPGAPLIGTVTAGNAQATVSFAPPASNGGSAITSYMVTSNPGTLTAGGTAAR
jgi:alpha-tubulin suppressor-like RCC1 family protein